MENVVSINKIDDINVKQANSSSTEVAIKFVTVNWKTRMAIIRLGYRPKGNVHWKEGFYQVRLTKHLVNWFCYPKTDYDADRKPTGTVSTGYQRFMIKNGLDYGKPLNAHTFSSENHSPEYAENPFRISGYLPDGQATLALVNMPNLRKNVRHDPMNPGNPEVYYTYPKRRDNGHILKLPRKYYRRLEMKTA